MHNPLVTSAEMLNQIRAFEANVRSQTLVVDPARERERTPGVDPSTFLFGELPYYQLTADDRSQVDPLTREAVEQMECALVRYAFDRRYCSLPYPLYYLETQGYPVYFDFGRGQPLVWLQLNNGVIFYVDLQLYMSKYPTNEGDTP